MTLDFFYVESYHQHRWLEAPVLKKVFPENPYKTSKWFVCRCAEIKEEIVIVLNHDSARRRQAGKEAA